MFILIRKKLKWGDPRKSMVLGSYAALEKQKICEGGKVLTYMQLYRRLVGGIWNSPDYLIKKTNKITSKRK